MKILKLFVQISVYPVVRQKKHTGGWGWVGVAISILSVIVSTNYQTSVVSYPLTLP
jgi:hypothetical protein